VLEVAIGIEKAPFLCYSQSAKTKISQKGAVPLASIGHDTEKIKRLHERKREASLLSAKMYQLGGTYARRAKRIAECSSVYRAKECSKDPSHHHHVIHTQVCRDRLCPICLAARAHRLSRRTQALVKKNGSSVRYLFLTVTVPNPPDGALKETLQMMTRGFGVMMRTPPLKGYVKGYVRTLEITRNGRSWHPHIHAILAVDPTYFGVGYMKQEEWLEMWNAAMQRKDIQQLHITAQVDGNAALEVSKYITKIETLQRQSLRLLKEFIDAVKNVRFWQAAGCMKISEKELERELESNVGHDEDHIDDTKYAKECPVCGAPIREADYVWKNGQYVAADDIPIDYYTKRRRRE
jgi:plasmid rolling circle replication initiator protein Rep